MGFSGLKIGGKCAFLCVGDDGSQPTVSTKFEQDIYNTTNLLNKCISQVQQKLDIRAEASNDISIIGVHSKGKGVNNINVEQTATVDVNLAIGLLLKAIQDSSADANTKLSAIDTIAQEVKNRGTEIQGDSSTADETLLKLSNDTNLSNIEELYYSLAYCFSVAASNKAVIMDIVAESESTNNITVRQYASASLKMINDIVEEMDNKSTNKQYQEYKTELDKIQKSESTGTGASWGDNAENSIKNWTNMLDNLGKTGIIAMVAIPIIIVLAIIALIFVFIFRGRNKQPQQDYQQYQQPIMYQQDYQQYYQQY